MMTRAITARMIAHIFFDGIIRMTTYIVVIIGAKMRPSIETRLGGISERIALRGASSFCFNVLLGVDIS